MKQYLSHVDGKRLLEHINQDIQGIPPIFYVADSNNPGLIRTWVASGGNINAYLHPSMIPLVAFVILMGAKKDQDTTLLIKTLVPLGADTSATPRKLLIPFPDEEHLLHEQTSPPARNQAWCTDELQILLNKHLNLSQRYILDRHARRKPPSARLKNAASILQITPLLGLHQFIIGQEYALRLLLDQILSHLVIQDNKPLILVFAGPSGHGKSEVGKMLGELMSLDTLRLDMASMKRETDLCGARAPFVGCEVGSPLNNFLAGHSGERALVFLDEFDKAGREVRETLLIPFGEGTYVDRRNNRPINASGVIWVVACNTLDETVMGYFENRDVSSILCSDTGHSVAAGLQDRLGRVLEAKFGYPFAGRVSCITPFLPFSAHEQAVIAHKYLLDLAASMKQPKAVQQNQLIGAVNLRFRNETALCRDLARKDYHANTGARSLEAAVKRRVRNAVVKKYLESNVVGASSCEEYVVDVGPREPKRPYNRPSNSPDARKTRSDNARKRGSSAPPLTQFRHGNRGAALSRLPQEAAVVATSATKHYGTEARSNYDARIDADVEKVCNKYTSKAKAYRFINIGDDIARDQEIKFPFYRSLDEDFSPDDLIFTDYLIECSDPFEIHYDLVVTLKSALMTFSLEIDGAAMGTVEAKFN
ncbi:hypothetical protein OQA88_2029 [Cercophora sp. LCS_1]